MSSPRIDPSTPPSTVSVLVRANTTWKVLRGFKTWDTAALVLSGFLINYNFFRPHITLNNKSLLKWHG